MHALIRNLLILSSSTAALAEPQPLPTKLPAGLKATLFAAPPMVNYPTFVEAAANGDLYVSVDKNGSIDTKPDRGFIYKLVDKDGDGKADERTVFASPVTSPRGLAVVGNTVICLHPPELEAFTDKDGDGIAEERKVLIKGIGFDLTKRPPDHTSNGVTLGIDGWLYLAIGDFGFMEAEGVDGRKFQFRGGGVVRVRPDGTGMELYASGTRNIYEVAVDPWLNLFARDNTNDGGGWDTRVEFYLGGVDLGYPRKFLHFTDETFPVLGIFGGGSGVGGVYVQEKGFGWPAGYEDALYTCDWGRNAIYRHQLTDKDASFAITQDTLLEIERPTDMKMDARGNAYLASWKGATFNYAGEEAGYIVRISPEKPTGKVVDTKFASKAPAALVADLTNPDSHRLRLAAQQEILQRGAVAAFGPMLEQAAKSAASVPGRIAAIFTLKQLRHAEANPFLIQLLDDAKVREFALRALADVPGEGAAVPTDKLVAALSDPNDHVKAQAAIALARLGRVEAAPALLAVAGRAKESGAAPEMKPRATTEVIRKSTPGRLGHLEADISGGKVIYLVATAGPDTFDLDHADWVEPHFTGPAGDQKLTDLKWKSASQGFGATHVNGNCFGVPMKIDGKPVAYGIGTHAVSVIAYDIPQGVTKFTASGGLDDSSAAQGELGSVEFQVFVDELPGRYQGGTTNQEAMYTDTARALPHVASQALIKLGAADACLKVLDSEPSLHAAAFRVLRQLHRPEVITALIERLGKASDATMQRGIVTALVRLAQEEGPWDGSSWGTRPDTTGPFYKRDKWAESPRIEQALRDFFARTSDELRNFLITELGRHSVNVPNLTAKVAEVVDPQWAKDQELLMKALQGTVKMNPGDIGLMEAQVAMEEALKVLDAKKGDAAHGAKLFTQQGCAACHVVGKDDSPKGPNLFDIALRYKPQEIMMSILNPSASVSQGFPTQIITLKDGEVASGFALREAGDEIIIRNMAAMTQKIATSAIAKQEKDEHVSSMTPGLLNNVSPQGLADLIAYFQSLK